MILTETERYSPEPKVFCGAHGLLSKQRGDIPIGQETTVLSSKQDLHPMSTKYRGRNDLYWFGMG
jgi:hypothetical protein